MAILISQTVNNSNATVGDSVNVESRIAQSIQETFKMSVTDITLYANNKIGVISGNLVCKIETDNTGHPSGTLVDANATVNFTNPAVPATVVLTFPGSFILLPNTKYWIVVDCADQAQDIYVNFAISTSSSYANGKTQIKTNGTWGSDSNTDDLYFILYGQRYGGQVLHIGDN